MLSIDAALGAKLVRELARVGSLPVAGGIFDERARTALVAFMRVENVENRVRDDGCIDRATLDYLEAAPSKLHA